MVDASVTTEQEIALNIARQLIEAGVPVFAASPCPEGCPLTTELKTADGVQRVPHKGAPGKYHLPPKWEKTWPAEVNLEKWRPGWGLAAVGGHTVDFLDVDPRNGGDVSLAELKASGHMPRIFSEAVTPSGGRHFAISATGERKLSGFLPGLDLQSGNPDGVGRGFVWIAPTVRASKDPRNAGELGAYRWLQPPDPEELEEWKGAHDPSVQGIRDRVTALRSTPVPRQRAPQAVDPDDPFLTTSSSFQSQDRSFTQVQAQDFVRASLLDLQGAPVGLIEERANTAAAILSHFVPEFWSVDQAMRLLEVSAGHTAYDPQGPSDWTLEKFRLVLDGTRPPLDPWQATRRPEPAAPPAQTMEAAPGEEPLSTLEKLKRRLVSASALASMPAPEPLVSGVLNLDTESWMIGAPGSLKSFVALDLAGHVGGGRDWQGHRVTRANVLYLAAEGSRGMVLRARAWEKSFGTMEGVSFLPYPVQVQSTDGQWEALVQIAKELDARFIVLDTQARITVGMDENQAKDMGVLINAVGLLKRATGACVLVVHHTGRNGGDARGSSALDGAQDTELKVVRSQDRKALACRVIQDKQKDMAEGDGHGLDLRFKSVDLGLDPVSGDPLSSLVLMGQGDAFDAAQGIQELEVDMAVWKSIPVPEAWTAKVVPVNSKWKRRTIQALADHGHTRGLTKAETERIVVDRFGERFPKKGYWDGVWAAVLEEAQSLVVNTGGERWALDQAALAGLKSD